MERTGGFKGTIQRHSNESSFDSENATALPFPKIAEEVQTLSKEKLERLRALMNCLSKTSSSCSLTLSGKSSRFLSFNASGTENI